MKKCCMRSDCYANVNSGEYINNCFALKEVYENDNECPFYKSNKVISLRRIKRAISLARFKKGEKACKNG